jgi:glycosyltransferase involved in cell wall biosynthesis
MHMKQKALVSFGGPFPYDKSFRGQSIVEGDLIKEATSRGMKSLIVSKYHVHKDPLHEKTEAMQRMIAEMAFSSDIRFRYKADFCDARNKCNMAIKSMKQDAFGHWANFYGLNDVKKLIEAYGKVYYFMHYYNSRFMEAEYFSKVVMHEKLCNAINAYYFIHVAPDQLVESEKNGGWRDEENTGGAVQSLVTAMESGCFKAFVAVSQAARDMWIELIKSFGYARETVDTAEKKMIAVPNGIDANLYGSSYIMPGSSVLAETRARLGFDPSVEKIVLVMTRPSISKGIDRINETLAAFNASSDPKLKRIGFLVTMPETEGTEPFLERIREMESLVSGNRLKVTIDVSKVVRSRPELECEFNGIQTMMPISYRNEKFYIEPIGYPLTCVSDVFLHLPYAEAFGLVVAESLMSGCAVITTDAGGIPEVTKNSKDAILFDHEKVVIRDVVDAIAASERPQSPNGAFVQQFSLKSQFDKIVGDGNE